MSFYLFGFMIFKADCLGKDMLNKINYFVKDYDISLDTKNFTKITWKTITISINCDDDPMLHKLKMGKNAFFLITTVIESPTNPLIGIIDIQRVAQIGKEHGIVTVIDKTFATPFTSVRYPCESMCRFVDS